MYKKTIKTSIIISVSILCVSSAYANTLIQEKTNSKFAATAKLSTLGPGFDINYGISKKLGLRFNYNRINMDIKGDKDLIDDDLKLKDGFLKLETLGALVDFYPKKSNFRVSTGLYKNNNQFSLDLVDKKHHSEIKVGDKNYNFDSNTETNILAQYKNLAPYLGIGWGNPLTSKGHWHLNLDAGVLYQGRSTTDMSIKGSGVDLETGKSIDLATDKDLQNEVRKEEASINKDLDSFKLLPVFSAGVSYRF